MHKTKYKQIFWYFHTIIFFFLQNKICFAFVFFFVFLLNFYRFFFVSYLRSDYTITTNITVSGFLFIYSTFMMVWPDNQLEECCPLLTSQMMMSHTVEDLNCLWRSNIMKILSIISSTTCHIAVDLSGKWSPQI